MTPRLSLETVEYFEKSLWLRQKTDSIGPSIWKLGLTKYTLTTQSWRLSSEGARSLQKEVVSITARKRECIKIDSAIAVVLES